MILLSLVLVVVSAATLALGIFSDSDPLVWTSLGAGLGAVALVAGSVVRRRRLVVAPGAGASSAGAVAVGSASPGVPPVPSPTPYRSEPDGGSPPRPGPPRPGPQPSPWSTPPPGGAPYPDAPRSGWTGAVPTVPADPGGDPAAAPPAYADPAGGDPAGAPLGSADPGAERRPAGDSADVAGTAAELSGAALTGAGLPADADTASSGDAGTPGYTGTPQEPPPDDGEPRVEDVPVRDALRVAQLADEVVVADGHPRYHLAGCPTLRGAEPVPLAVSAARRAGFTPCAVCAPDHTLLQRSRQRTAERRTET